MGIFYVSWVFVFFLINQHLHTLSPFCCLCCLLLICRLWIFMFVFYIYFENIFSQTVSYFLNLFMVSVLYKSFFILIWPYLSVISYLSSGFCDLLRIFILSPNYKNMLSCSCGYIIIFLYCCVCLFSIQLFNSFKFYSCMVRGRGLSLFLKYVNSCFELKFFIDYFILFTVIV